MLRRLEDFNDTYINFHVLIETIIHDKAVRHSYTVRFHGVTSNIGIIAHIGIVEVGCRFGSIATQERLVKRREGSHRDFPRQRSE